MGSICNSKHCHRRTVRSLHIRTTGFFKFIVLNNKSTSSESNEILDFCMDGRIRSGADNTDTWLKMLQNIQQCTEAVAKAIVGEYPTIYSLYEAYTRCASTADAEMLLADIEVVFLVTIAYLHCLF